MTEVEKVEWMGNNGLYGEFSNAVRWYTSVFYCALHAVSQLLHIDK